MEKVEEMKKFLTGLDLTQDVLNSLFRQLDKSDQTLDNWKRRTEALGKRINNPNPNPHCPSLLRF